MQCDRLDCDCPSKCPLYGENAIGRLEAISAKLLEALRNTQTILHELREEAVRDGLDYLDSRLAALMKGNRITIAKADGESHE